MSEFRQDFVEKYIPIWPNRVIGPIAKVSSSDLGLECLGISEKSFTIGAVFAIAKALIGLSRNLVQKAA